MSIHAIPEPTGPPAEINIRDYLDIIQRRRATFIQVFVLLLAIGIVAAAVSKPVYQTRAKLLVPAGSNSVNIVDSNNPMATLYGAFQPDSVETQLQVLQSGPFLADAERQANIVPKPGVAPPSVKVEQVQGASGELSNVIQITAEGGDPHDIANLANAIVKLHLDRTDLMRNSGLHDTIETVRSEKEKTARSLADADRRLNDFRKAHPGVELSTEREARAGEYAALLARVLELQSSITTTQAQMASLRTRLKQEPPQLYDDVVKDNPRVAKLQDHLDELGFRRMDLLQEFRPTSRQVRDVDQQIARLRRQMAAEPKEIHGRTHAPNPARALLQTRLEELEATLQGSQQGHSAALAQFNAKKAMLDSMGPWEGELSRLTKDRDAIQASYTRLGDQLRDLDIRVRARLYNARIIESAYVPTFPIRPRKATNIALSALLAFLLAISTAFLQEYLDDRVNAPDDLERIAPLRPLAHVPLMPPEQPRLVAALPNNSHVAEAYRALRSSIGFAGMDAPIRRLQITSTTQAEGKSTTATNLATVMARDGKRVVLVDADLRWPSLHQILDLSNYEGLSEVLAGMKSLDEVIQDTEIENLRVVPAGTVPPNPAELLGTQAFDDVLEQLGEQADVVVVDTPPCLPVTDPLIVAARMDGVVLVVQIGHTRKAAVKQMVELLAQARTRIVGVVYNQVQPNRRGYYYYEHYHYYGSATAGDTALPGEHHRRNGKGRPAELQSGKATAPAGRGSKEEEEA